MMPSRSPIWNCLGVAFLALLGSGCAQRQLYAPIPRLKSKHGSQVVQSDVQLAQSSDFTGATVEVLEDQPAQESLDYEESQKGEGPIEIPGDWELLPDLTDLELALAAEAELVASTLDESTAPSSEATSEQQSIEARADLAPARIQGRVIGLSQNPALRNDSPIVVLAILKSESEEVAMAHGSDCEPIAISREPDQDAARPYAVMPPGTEVLFENRDEIYHKFFSTSGDNAFELGTLASHETKSMTFDHPGAIQVYCSLHAGKQMNLMVVPTPFFTVAEADGSYEIEGLAPGSYVFEAWSDDLRSKSFNVNLREGQESILDIPMDSISTVVAE